MDYIQNTLWNSLDHWLLEGVVVLDIEVGKEDGGGVRR